MTEIFRAFTAAEWAGVLVSVALFTLFLLTLRALLDQRRLTRLLAALVASLEGAEKDQERTERIVREEIARSREEFAAGSRQVREEIVHGLEVLGNALRAHLTDIATLQKNQLDSFARQLSLLTHTNEQQFDAMRHTLEERLLTLQQENSRQLTQMRDQAVASAREQRDEVVLALRGFHESVENRLETVRRTVENRLQQIQEDNARQLDQMRATVDEKLHGTLEKRLGESFKQVSERLEQVHKGLGEMQALAVGVGDLKRVLSNVKVRGAWGEIQLEALLEQILSPEQYDRNVRTGETSDQVVEFAIKLPGRGDGDGQVVWLPIDAKFPMEDYQRLLEAQERSDPGAVDTAARTLATRIRTCARDIHDKYLRPPRTTDFGVMFLPIEGLYAEVVRRPDLVESIQRQFRVVIAGPTTFAALLNSLQMGFRTLTIQQRSSEVWKLLGAVKTEFTKFGDLLDGVKRKLLQASNTMDDAARRSRAIERRLRQVEELPAGEAHAMFPAALVADTEDDDG